MKNFITIDFETANSEKHSVCEIGIAVVENNKIIENISYLVRPKDNRFDRINTRIHGINAEMVANEPEFPAIWEKVKHYFNENTLVWAHYASFDFQVLRAVLNEYSIDVPSFKYSCSYLLAKRTWKDMLSFKLSHLSAKMDIKIEHHTAKSDANACAEVVLKAMNIHQISSINKIEETLLLKVNTFDYKGYQSLSLSDVKNISVDETKFDPSHFFYGKVVVFTGALHFLTRAEAQMKVKEIGGVCGSSVSAKTNFLIMGIQDVSKYGEGFKSSKIKKAESLIAKGKNIEIMAEDDFLRLF